MIRLGLGPRIPSQASGSVISWINKDNLWIKVDNTWINIAKPQTNPNQHDKTTKILTWKKLSQRPKHF